MIEIQIETTVEREIDGQWKELDVTVKGNYYPGSPATYWHPGDPDEVEITLAALKDGTQLELTDEEKKRVEEEIAEKACKRDEPDFSFEETED